MYQKETSRSLIMNKLLIASQKNNMSWLFNKQSPGRIKLIDGRTGLPFDNSVLVGKSYIVKLIQHVYYLFQLLAQNNLLLHTKYYFLNILNL